MGGKPARSKIKREAACAISQMDTARDAIRHGRMFGLKAALVVIVASSSATAQLLETPGSWTRTGSLITARLGHTATLLADGRVLVAGGSNESGVLNAAEIYEPSTGVWRATASLNLARHHFTATLLANGKVLVVGGYTSPNPPSFGITGTAELYDPVSETWSFTSPLSAPRAWHAAERLRVDQVAVIGGASPVVTSSVEAYDTATEAWTTLSPLSTPRYEASATILYDGRMLVIAGTNDGDLASTLGSVELYDPVLNTWRDVGSLATSRALHSTTRLFNGSVLIAGGYTWPPTTFATAERYDPTAETWRTAGRLHAARNSHAAVLLPDGKVLATGGFDWSRRVALQSTELYDPTSDAWSLAEPMWAARRTHTATLLLSGKVLVAGGFGSQALNNAELYELHSVSGEAIPMSNHAVSVEGW